MSERIPDLSERLDLPDRKGHNRPKKASSGIEVFHSFGPLFPALSGHFCPSSLLPSFHRFCAGAMPGGRVGLSSGAAPL